MNPKLELVLQLIKIVLMAVLTFTILGYLFGGHIIVVVFRP